MKIPFVGPTYAGRSSNINAQRCVNWYPEIDKAEGKNVISLINTPGTVLEKTLGTGPIRGMHVVRSGASAGQRIFVVSGQELYELDEDFNATLVTTLSSAAGKVSMADNGVANGDQLLISDGVYKGGIATNYIVNMTTHAVTNLSITGGALEGIPLSTVAFLDGYFVGIEQNSGRFFVSGSYSGTSWDLLDFATAEGDPDNLVGMVVDHRELWLFGETTTEVWNNIGAADFPFQRISGAVIEWGCSSQWSVTKADNAVYWLGRNRLGHGHVLRAVGYQPEVISTPAIEFIINSMSTLEDAEAFTYQEEGHSFYVLTFPTDGRTLVFDISTGMWHERSSNGIDNRWVANNYAFFNDKHLVGDPTTGKIYSLSLDTYTDNGSAIHRMRRTQYIADDLQRLFFNRLQVDFESGVGLLPTQQGDDPQAMLRWSDDGGHTWSHEIWVPIGKMGQYENRAIWRRLGSARQRIFELKITDPVKPIVINAHARVGAGVQ